MSVTEKENLELESENQSLKFRIKELEKAIKRFNDEVYEEHCMSKATSHSLTKLLNVAKMKEKP